MVPREGLLTSSAGLVLGLPLALSAGRALQALLYGTQPFDPQVRAAVVATLTVAGVVACAIPARRAASADPLVTLRAD